MSTSSDNYPTTTSAPSEQWVSVAVTLPKVDTSQIFYVVPAMLFAEINREDGKIMHGIRCFAAEGTIILDGDVPRAARPNEQCVVWFKSGLAPLLALRGCLCRVTPHPVRKTRKPGHQFRPFDVDRSANSVPGAIVPPRSLEELDHERLPAGYLEAHLSKNPLLPEDLVQSEVSITGDDE